MKKREGTGVSGSELLYVRVEGEIEDLLVRGRYRAGDRVPPEEDLAGDLGVSRATVRSGLGRLVERGILKRRQGSGTFLVRPPEGARLRNGFERLESYTVHAERLGLSLGCSGLEVEGCGATSEESEALDLRPEDPVIRVSRVLLVDGERAAWMIDALPEEIMEVEGLRGKFRPEAMVLDLLVSEGVEVGYSTLQIEAAMISPQDEVGGSLEVKETTAALSLTETMYLAGGRPVQFSRNVFLPGHLDLHVLRELFEVKQLS